MTRKTLCALLLAAASAGAGLLGGAPACQADQKDSRLVEVFDQLGQAQTLREALLLESAVWQIWGEIEDDDVAFLYRRGVEAMSADRPDDALGFFTEVTKRAPDFAEGWNKRATVLYLMGDFAASVVDVEHTLALEPKHFGALSGLGMIYLQLGRDAAALKAFEAALKVHPFLSGARQRSKELRDKLGGKPT
ncbi:MAG: tetratricopeptide repeat protein [Alphaproteobacteria bacterium]|nr:tetratricopeptide repeat protein [Alphaproteobacteria bacterium]